MYLRYSLILGILCISCKYKKSEDTSSAVRDSVKKLIPIVKMDTVYPFSEASSVDLVSYKVRWDKSGGQVEKSSLIKNGKFYFKDLQIQENLHLDSVKKLKVFNALYNFHCSTHEMGSCFTPRHALVFKDGKGKAFEVIEICLSCGAYASTFEPNIANCSNKYQELEKVFKGIGVRYFEESKSGK